MPAANLASYELAGPDGLWRSVGNAAGELRFHFGGDPQPVSLVRLDRHLLPSTASLQFVAYDDTAWTTVLETGPLVPAWNLSPPVPHAAQFFDRAWTYLRLADDGLTDPIVCRAGKILYSGLGAAPFAQASYLTVSDVVMHKLAAQGLGNEYRDLSKKSRGQAGHSRFERRAALQVRKFRLQHVPDDLLRQQIDGLWLEHRKDRPFVFVSDTRRPDLWLFGDAGLYRFNGPPKSQPARSFSDPALPGAPERNNWNVELELLSHGGF